MSLPEIESFPAEVEELLGFYVYRLIDPRNGETFYIGKGKDNRVFAHIRAEKHFDGDEFDNKIKRIREIHNAGFEVAHVIHRHGMNEETALEVEAALIDAYPGLTNIAGGIDGDDRGVAHAQEIVRRYSAAEAVFQHKVLLINVNRSPADVPLYDATRYAWKISKSKAKQAEIVLAVRKGLIIGAFVANDWLEATSANFPGREEVPGRLGFVGREAPAEIKELYLSKRIPDSYRKPGAANPIKYTW